MLYYRLHVTADEGPDDSETRSHPIVSDILAVSYMDRQSDSDGVHGLVK